MRQAILFALLGYLCGSLLFARAALSLFGKKDAYLDFDDRNPGTANAFRSGGVLCGSLALLGELAKGFFPVHLYLASCMAEGTGSAWGLAPVLAAPVLGHILPCFHRFRGGKGIAVTFGCLLGLAPDFAPLLVMIASFLFYCLIVRVSPDFYRTIAAYLTAALAMGVFCPVKAVCVGFYVITGLVCWRLHCSEEAREKIKVRMIWKH